MGSNWFRLALNFPRFEVEFLFFFRSLVSFCFCLLSSELQFFSVRKKMSLLRLLRLSRKSASQGKTLVVVVVVVVVVVAVVVVVVVVVNNYLLVQRPRVVTKPRDKIVMILGWYCLKLKEVKYVAVRSLFIRSSQFISRDDCLSRVQSLFATNSFPISYS